MTFPLETRIKKDLFMSRSSSRKEIKTVCVEYTVSSADHRLDENLN